jgi:hypothetical protein
MKSACKMGPWPMGNVTDATCREFWPMEDLEDWSLQGVMLHYFKNLHQVTWYNDSI